MYKQIQHRSHGIHFTFAEKGLGILLSRECYFQNCKAMYVVHCLKRGSVLEKREKSYSLCLLAIFGNIQNGLISSSLLHRTMWVNNVFNMVFFACLILDPT